MAEQKLVIRKASRQKAFLKLGVSSPSGGGKTLGSLLIAYGLMKEKYPKLSDSELWDKIVIIDSENGSGELYVGSHVADSNITIGEYATLPLEAPFEPNKYTQGIKLAHESGFEVCIIDSMTHMWAGTGGALEKQGKIADRIGNSWTAWRDVTPEITALIDAILQTPIHVISTMRSKTDHVQEKDSNGRTVVRKVGMNPIIRDGMEFEFTVFFEIDSDHTTFCSKDRTGLFDGKYFKITPQVGRDAMDWLESGSDTAGQVIATNANPLDETVEKIIKVWKSLGSDNDEALELVHKYNDGKNNPKVIKELDVAQELLSELNKLKEKIGE